jgi:hypothetical protein
MLRACLALALEALCHTLMGSGGMVVTLWASWRSSSRQWHHQMLMVIFLLTLLAFLRHAGSSCCPRTIWLGSQVPNALGYVCHAHDERGILQVWEVDLDIGPPVAEEVSVTMFGYLSQVMSQYWE